jgi:hypothetical protein
MKYVYGFIVTIYLLFLFWCFPGFGQEVQVAKWNPYASGTAAAASCASCTSGNDGTVFTAGYTVDAALETSATMAYPFTTATSKCVTGIKTYIGDGGTSRGVTCEIWNTDGTNPTSIVAAGYTATITDMPDNNAPPIASEFLFSSCQTLSAGSYWAVCSLTGVEYIGNAGLTGDSNLHYNDGTWRSDFPMKWQVEVLGCDPS